MLVLLVEDNRALATNTIEFLEAEGFECDYADNGLQGYELARTGGHDVLILDIMLPGFTGLELCERLRGDGVQTPILMLTARDSLDDKVSGFDAGTDDYLVKPFALPELVARLQALHKRASGSSPVVTVGELTMNTATRQVMRAGQAIELNQSCWKLLLLLMRNSPNVVSKQQMERELWGDNLPDSDALRSHLYLLRKLIDKPFETPLLHTIRNVGIALR